MTTRCVGDFTLPCGAERGEMSQNRSIEELLNASLA
jgi:hypothetical protein